MSAFARELRAAERGARRGQRPCNFRGPLGGGMFGGGLPGKLGFVGTRTGAQSVAAGLSIPYAHRVYSVATDDIVGEVTVIWGNFYADELASLASVMTVEAYLEWPIGNLTRMTFNGSNVGTAPSISLIAGKANTPSKIPVGSEFFIRYYVQGSASYYFGAAPPNTARGEAVIANSNVITGNMVSANTETHRPLAIVGRTTRKSYAVLGTSIQVGTGGNYQAAAPSPYGDIETGIGPNIGWTCLAFGGATLSGFLTAHALRDQIINKYAYGVLDGYGTNDFFVGGVSAATFKSEQITCRGFYPLKPFYTNTVDPQTTSTDNWATLVNQTVKANEAQRVLYNTDLRAHPTGVGDGFFDTAILAESGSTGKWIVNGTANYGTGDGIHPSQVVYSSYSFPGFGGALP